MSPDRRLLTPVRLGSRPARSSRMGAGTAVGTGRSPAPAPSGRRRDGGPTRSRARAGVFSPEPAPVVPASSASSSRQFAGYSPDWEISRTAPAAARKSSNSTPQEALNCGPRPHPHPGLGDHPEDPLRADQQPVGRGARPGARQPPALPGPPRRDRPHRLDQVVDVGVESREVPPGPGRDPAAQRRVLEATGGSGAGSARARAAAPPTRARLPPPGSAPPATRHRPPAPDPAAAGRARPPAARRAAPRPHRRRWSRRQTGITAAPSASDQRQHGLDLRLVARKGNQIRRVRELPRNPRTTSRYALPSACDTRS